MLPSIKESLVHGMRGVVRCLLAAACLVTAAQAQTESSGLRGMAINPIMYRVGGHVGSPLNLPIEVQNLEMRPLKITLKLRSVAYSDWSYGANLDAKNSHDCSSWFGTTTFTTTIDKTSTYRFPLKCVIPKVDPGVYYCLGTIDPNIVGDTSVIIAEYQIPIIVFVGMQPKLDLKFGTPNLTVTDKLSGIDVPFINDSDAFTVVGAAVQLRDSVTGRSIAIRSDSDRNLYPQSKRLIHFAVPKLSDGQYRIDCTCQSGTRSFRPIVAQYVVNKGKVALSTPDSVISLPPFTVDPPRLRQSMPAGAQRLVTIKFTNQTDAPLTINLTPHRLTQSANGLLQVTDDPPTAPLTVTLNPNTLTIPARRTSTLRVTLAVDGTAVGDNWFAITALSADGASMSEEVYGSINIPNTGSPKLGIVPKETGFVGDVPLSIDYEVTNNGNIALLPKISASVMEGGLTPVARLEVPLLGDGGILPGATLRNRLMLPPDLKAGAYTVRLEYQYGEALSEIKQLPFIVPAPKKKATAGTKPKRGGKR